ncbi:hypothetical protein [Fibrella forsythiae]|uniref:Uncharacterized protein n=1 Tax=Fibrella forsythiae TaxID=2817061 RepID=A0ABS3JAI1_9BACT|nr:hypothetical protein [Fibrella forsythiae]MBO0946990.1 hypothetical protein [Fibrella forsythiae]
MITIQRPGELVFMDNPTDLTPIFYFVWALFSLVFGVVGVVLSWRLGPAGFPRFCVVGVRILTLLLLVSAGVFFVLAFS